MTSTLAGHQPPPQARGGAPPKARLVHSLTLEAPLVGVESARLALRCAEEELMDLIISGQLQWAFDLRAKGESRPYIRILTQSIARLQQARAPAGRRRRRWSGWFQPAPSFEEVFDSIFQHHRAWISTTELMRQWNCSLGHVRNLMEQELLEVAQKPYTFNQVRLISRQSIADFMRQRTIH